MKLYPIQCGKFKLDGGAMFGVVPKSIWQKTNPADEKKLGRAGDSLPADRGRKETDFGGLRTGEQAG